MNICGGGGGFGYIQQYFQLEKAQRSMNYE